MRLAARHDRVFEPSTVLQEPGNLAEPGRGLHVVGAVADMWGYATAGEAGKVVWAVFSAKPGPARPDP